MDNYVCPICLDNIEVKREQDNNVNIIVLKGCRHVYHKRCLKLYWENVDRKRCPLCRDENVTTEKMAAIWKIYIQAMNVDNVHVKVVSGSPVGVTYQSVNLLNNGELVTSKPTETHPDAQDIFDQAQNEQIQIALYAGQEDFTGRYSAFLKSDAPYKGNRVVGITGRQVDRYASGTETRQAIHDIAIGIKDADTLRNLLPGPSAGNEFTGPGFLNPEQEDQVVNILLS